MPFCRVNEVKLYYEDHGPKDQTPLVFIHGADWRGKACLTWKPIVEHFRGDRRTIALDLRGHGQSDKPQGQYAIEELSEDFFSLMKTLEVEKAIVVGYSMGGMIALRFALDHQEMVERLILISTKHRRLSLFKRLVHPIWLSFAMRKLPASSPPKHVLRSHEYAGAKFDVTTDLQKIRVPTLIIHGSKETGLTDLHLDQARYMKEHIPNAELIILEGSKHSHVYDTPERTAEAIEKFLRD
jgi:pimeloyl-ACP methyl ester carboxylesterase